MRRGGGGGENNHNRDKGLTTAPCKLRLWLRAAGWGWDAAACWPRALRGAVGQMWGQQQQHSGAGVAPFPLPSCSVCQLLLPGASRGASHQPHVSQSLGHLPQKPLSCPAFLPAQQAFWGLICLPPHPGLPRSPVSPGTRSVQHLSGHVARPWQAAEGLA